MKWPWINDPINPDATPDIDNWGIDQYWTPTDWMTWYKAMVAKYGSDAAGIKFKTSWEALSSFGIEKMPGGYIYGSDFINFFLSVGIDLRTMTSAVFTTVQNVENAASSAITNVADSLGDAASSVVKGAGDIIDGIPSTVKWITIAAIVVGIIIALSYAKNLSKA